MSKVYVEFDGSSKGNPGRGGAGAILRSEDGTVIAKVGRGLGTTTNNAAEYEGLKLGLETARDLGYGHVHAQGDSQLVYKQVQGEWQTKNENMDRLCSDARELKGQFKSFDMSHVPRDYNSGADREANKAVNLPAGEVYKEHCGHGPLVEEEFPSDEEDADEEEKEEAVIHDDDDDNDLDIDYSDDEAVIYDGDDDSVLDVYDNDDEVEEEVEEAVMYVDDDDNDLDVNDSGGGGDDDVLDSNANDDDGVDWNGYDDDDGGDVDGYSVDDGVDDYDDDEVDDDDDE